ncbi:hypothetical protein [Paludibacter propionicigenes]|nr:hypothetical protein [Paludibacter propionicigenes]
MVVSFFCVAKIQYSTEPDNHRKQGFTYRPVALITETYIGQQWFGQFL